MGAKITLKDGEFTVVDGPFTEAKELVGGWALLECRDLDEAVEWSKRFLSVLGEGEVRVRPVFVTGVDQPMTDAAVVESVACRPPIRPPPSRRSSAWSSRGSSPRWRACVGDIGLAEELAQDALVDALRQWPRDGTPRNPGAWLTAVGKRKAIDLFRRDRTLRDRSTPSSGADARAVRRHAGRRRDWTDEEPSTTTGSA